MPGTLRYLSHTRSSAERLPEWATRYAVLVSYLNETGVLPEVSERLRVPRQGGYCDIDVFLFFLAYFTWRGDGGLQGFGQASRRFGVLLAALGGRQKWPTPSAVSRYLSRVSPEHLATFKPWIFSAALDLAPWVGHLLAASRDAFGNRWHIFDWDPTVTTLRQRVLPAGAELPEPVRLSSRIAKRGYGGRKRGDVQLSRSTLQHAGTSLWFGIWMGPGNAEPRQSLEEAVEQLRAWYTAHGLDHQVVIVRSDGAFGNVPSITACQEAGLHYLTRLSHYEWLTKPEIQAFLAAASWEQVESSGSGPLRWATELGQMWLTPDPQARNREGQPFLGLRTRVVVSRFAATAKHGTGVMLDGWQYELYGTDLGDDRWPACDVVTHYYGRCGEENRFAQEDHELKLDHIFSYTLAGQELANTIGLFVWNLQLLLGILLEYPLYAELTHQLPRPAALKRTLFAHRSASDLTEGSGTSTRDEATALVSTDVELEPPVLPTMTYDELTDFAVPTTGVSEEAGTSPSLTRSPPGQSNALAVVALQELHPTERTHAERAQRSPPGEQEASISRFQETDGSKRPAAPTKQPEQSVKPDDGAGDPLARDDTPTPLQQALHGLDWNALLGPSRPDWRWAVDTDELLCPTNTVLPLYKVRFRYKTTAHLIFRALPFSCRTCEKRAGCTSNTDESFRKEVCIAVDASEGQQIKELAEQWLWPHSPPSPWSRRNKRKTTAASTVDNILPEPTPGWERPADAPDVGPYQCTGPMLVPSELRKRCQAVCASIETYVRVVAPPQPEKIPRYVAMTPSRRQRRRKTWSERHQANAIADAAQVTIEFRDGRALAPLLPSLRAQIHCQAAS